MKHPTISRWLHRLLVEDGPEPGDRDVSARAQRAREDAQRWLESLQAEHQRQLVERHERTTADPSDRSGRRH